MIPMNTQLLLYAHSRGYRVLPDGTAVSASGRKLVPIKYSTGYVCFTVQSRTTGLKGKVGIHRLQAYQLFGELIFEKGVHVRHLDGNKHNNAASNISVGSAKLNSLDRPKDCRVRQSKLAASKLRKLSDKQLSLFWKDRNAGMSLSKLATKYGISKSATSYIVNGKTYKQDVAQLG